MRGYWDKQTWFSQIGITCLGPDMNLNFNICNGDPSEVKGIGVSAAFRELKVTVMSARIQYAAGLAGVGVEAWR